MKQILIFISLFLAIVCNINAQSITANQFNGRLQMTTVSNVSDSTWSITGYFTNSVNKYTTTQIAVNDKFFCQIGANTYVGRISVINSASDVTKLITFRVICNYPNPPNNIGAIVRTTSNGYPVFVDGLPNALQAGIQNYFATLINTNAAGNPCERTITKTAHGFVPGTPLRWNGSAYVRPTIDSLIPDLIVVRVLTANTFVVSTCGIYPSDLPDGLYWYTSAAPGYSLTQDTVKVPLFQVLRDTMMLNPIVGFNLMAGSGSGDVTSAVLADTAAAIRADFPTEGSSISIVPDTFGLPEIKEYAVAVGISANESVTNYTPASIDAVRYKFSTSKFGFGTSTEYGGWLANGTANDSISITAPFGVVIGDSQAQGAPGRGGRLDPKGASVAYTATYPDSTGQLSYHLRQLTKMRWYNHGIGSQTSRQIRARFSRDVLGQNVNISDGRPNQTLPGKPYICVIIAGINDVFGSITPQEVIENLRWMAASCNENGIKCVVLNLPGDEAITYAIARNLEIVNKFLNEGGLDSYNAKVVDYNTWWKNPAWNSLDKQSSLIVDDIHPSTIGYDSLATYIFRRANLPVLSKLIVSTELAPTGFTGFSRPNSINLNGTTYAVTTSSDIDTLEITNVLKDTVWVKINTSTNITGTSYSGFSHLQWFLDNNPTNRQYYTKRRGYAAPTGAAILNSLKITAESYANVTRLAILFPALENAFSVTTGGSTQVDVGYGASFTNSEMLRVHGIVGISSNLFAQQDAKIGNFQILRSGFPTASGAGVTAGIEALKFYFGAGDLEFGHWLGNSATRTWNSSNIAGHVIWRSGFAGALNANGRTAVYHNEIPNYNVTFVGGITSAKVWYRYYNPTVTSLPAGVQEIYMENVRGDNLFNTTSGSTSIGNTSPLAKLHVTGDCIITSTLWLNAAKTVGIFSGTGTPEGSVTASVGSTFHRTDGGALTSYYVKESGSGNTGWVAK